MVLEMGGCWWVEDKEVEGQEDEEKEEDLIIVFSVTAVKLIPLPPSLPRTQQDAKIEPEEFTSRLQTELKSSPQPYLVPFLKVTLTLLDHSFHHNWDVWVFYWEHKPQFQTKTKHKYHRKPPPDGYLFPPYPPYQIRRWLTVPKLNSGSIFHLQPHRSRRYWLKKTWVYLFGSISFYLVKKFLLLLKNCLIYLFTYYLESFSKQIWTK